MRTWRTIANWFRDIGAKVGLCDDSVTYTIRSLRAQRDSFTGLDYADLMVRVFQRFPDGFTMDDLAGLMREIAAEKAGAP